MSGMRLSWKQGVTCTLWSVNLRNTPVDEEPETEKNRKRSSGTDWSVLFGTFQRETLHSPWNSSGLASELLPACTASNRAHMPPSSAITLLALFLPLCQGRILIVNSQGHHVYSHLRLPCGYWNIRSIIYLIHLALVTLWNCFFVFLYFPYRGEQTTIARQESLRIQTKQEHATIRCVTRTEIKLLNVTTT